MYCSTCGTPLSAELSFCNRCGTSLKKERPVDNEKSIVAALTTAMILIGIAGLGLIIGGSIALKVAAQLAEPGVVMFMLLSFTIIGGVEFMLSRQLSRVLGKGREQERLEQTAQPLFQPAMMPASEARAGHLRSLPEPIPSVTENTTRTLENSLWNSPREDTGKIAK